MSLYTIDRDSDTPLYIQIRDNIIEAVQSQELSFGDKLPAVSLLAKEIGVTQATVRRALQDLGSAGYTECHVGRGTFICDPESTEPAADEQQLNSTPSAVMVPLREEKSGRKPVEYATRRLRSGIRKALFDIMPLAHKPGTIQLTRGIPDGELLPPNFIEEINEETLAGGSKQYIQATEELGLYELREEIAMRFNECGTAVTPDQVLITNGSLQAITLVAQAYLEKKPAVICETPCFQGVTDTFTAMGHWVDTILRDEEGPQIDKLHANFGNAPHLLYICPYVHNPMGTDLSEARAKGLVEWARQSGSVIIADEIFKDLRFNSEAQPSLFKELGGEQTIVVSSLSKSVMTGLRLGWIISSPDRIRELARLKHIMDHSTPAFIQGMGLTIFKSGKFDTHTAAMRKIYQERMNTLLKALKAHMPKGVSWSTPIGGFSILVELPRGYSSVALLLNAIDRGVSFLPGPLFDIDQRYVHAMRLSTAWSDKHQIKEGIELLGSCIEDFISQPPGDSGLSGLGNFQ